MKIKFDKNSEKLIKQICEIGRKFEQQDTIRLFETNNAKPEFIDKALETNSLIDEIIDKLPKVKLLPRENNGKYDAMLSLGHSSYNQCLVHVIDILESFKK